MKVAGCCHFGVRSAEPRRISSCISSKKGETKSMSVTEYLLVWTSVFLTGAFLLLWDRLKRPKRNTHRR
jgi:hypothetical protein